MTNSGTKHKLLFLNWIIGKLDKMNLEFQSGQFRLSTLYSSVTDVYRSILGAFIKDKILNSLKLSKINPENKSFHLRVENVSLGRCEILLWKEPLGERKKRFRQDCLKFMIELCVQISKRFPIEEENILGFA